MTQFVKVGQAYFFAERIPISVHPVVDALQKEQNVRRRDVAETRLHPARVAHEQPKNVRLEFSPKDLVAGPIVANDRDLFCERPDLQWQFASCGGHDLLGNEGEFRECHRFGEHREDCAPATFCQLNRLRSVDRRSRADPLNRSACVIEATRGSAGTLRPAVSSGIFVFDSASAIGTLPLMSKLRVVVAGGGAAGFFAAIICAEANSDAQVVLLEATAHLLAKVRVSGGGRCNVTHACFEPRDLVKRYPRGARELLGAFHRWQPRDTIAWFKERGVELKTEDDGRMFPTTDDSATIVDCLSRAAQAAGVEVRTRTGLKTARREGGTFVLDLTTGDSFVCDCLLLATGGNRSSAGYQIAEAVGHTIEPLVPSLFTFQIADPRLDGLAGLSVAGAVATVDGTKLRETGPLLITHWGMSGPAILKLSAWGARELAALEYRFTVRMNWLGGLRDEAAREALNCARSTHPRRHVATWNPFGLPGRLWERLVTAAGVAASAPWTSLSNQTLFALAGQLTSAAFVVTGKSTNKEEFVTCGGIRLKEVDFKTMQSRLCPGLFFAGEILDVDGITGGFNFQAAWTTGHLAGTAMAGFSL